MLETGFPLTPWIKSPTSSPPFAAAEPSATFSNAMPPSSLLAPKAENSSPLRSCNSVPCHAV